ncbi:MAG TPA: hypothetical protein DDY82_04890 [Clostridiales bacterium]|nr:hypothetical protein [Clostridiales bacterium]HBJ98379.1 hypothetical protein [Clostridiales bacterium]
MDKNVFIVLQKYSLEVLFLALLALICDKLILKAFKDKAKKISFYVPYVLGIIFYAIYSLIFLKSSDNVFNMGITTGAICMIYDSIISEDDSLKKLLTAFVKEENVKEAEKAIKKSKFQKEEVEKIVKNYSALPLTEQEVQTFVTLILQKKE